MPGPFYTTNESEFTRLEGMYIRERTPPSEISGAFFGDVSIATEAIRGPVDKAVLCTSPSRVREVFGGRDQGSGGATTSPLWRALLNKPFGRIWITRACASAAVVATHNFSDVVPTAIIRVDATSKGQWGNNVSVTIADATDGDVTHFNLTATYLGKTYTYKNLNTSGSNDNTLAVIGTDDGNVIKVTKLANGRPIDATASLSTGADDSIADSDFTGTNRALAIANACSDVGVVFLGERMSAALKSAIATLAASASDRVYLIGADSETVDVATAATDVASYHSDRIIYCYNHLYTLDPETTTEVLVGPEAWMASILSQIDVDIHPGEEDTKQFTSGIIRLYNEGLTRGDYITLKDAGICALEKQDGFAFVSGVSTYLADGTGKEQVTRRRMTDYLQKSIANNLKHDVKKKNTLTRRKQILGKVISFLEGLKNAERIVEAYQVLTDGDAGNTDVSRAQGLEKVFMRVKLIGHILFLVLDTEVGQTVTIKEAA